MAQGAGADKARLFQGPFPIVPGSAPQPGAGVGTGLVTHTLLLVGLLCLAGTRRLLNTHRGDFRAGA